MAAADPAKAYQKAVTEMVTAQQMLIRHQIDMNRLQVEIGVNHNLMAAFAAAMAQDPGAAFLHVQYLDKWLKGTQELVRMQIKEPKLIENLRRAQDRLEAAAKNMT